MADATTPPDHYAAVLSDLRAKRDEIDQAIALLTRLAGGTASQSVPAVDQTNGETDNPEGQFLGMSIPDAAIKLLTARKRTMGNAEIYRDLRAGGLVLNSKDPANVISSVLTRRFKDVGDVVRVDRGTWGLKAWYPGRSFKAKAAMNDSDAAAAVDRIIEGVLGEGSVDTMEPDRADGSELI